MHTILALCLFLTPALAHADSWMLLRQTHGGDLKYNRDLSQYECEVARDRLLGLPATKEEKRDAKEKEEKRKRDALAERMKDVEKIVAGCQWPTWISQPGYPFDELEEGWDKTSCSLKGTALLSYRFSSNEPKDYDCKVKDIESVTCKSETPSAKIREFLTRLAKDGEQTLFGMSTLSYGEPAYGDTKTAECFHLQEEAGKKK